MLLGAELEALPAWVRAAAHVPSVELRTLRQEKKGPAPLVSDDSPRTTMREAWWTCIHCPQPYRWWVHEGYREGFDIVYPSEEEIENCIRKGLNRPKPVWVTVKRCKRCNRMRTRHHRAKKRLRGMLQLQIEHMGTSARFVTLTVPNRTVALIAGILEDEKVLGDLVRELKAQVNAFTRRVCYQDKVIGSVEFYEQTYKIDVEKQTLSVNTHVHCVWLGNYWPQGDLQSHWSHGIVDISKPNSVNAVMKYISKYVTKDHIPGVRCSETRGVCRAVKPTTTALRASQHARS